MHQPSLDSTSNQRGKKQHISVVTNSSFWEEVTIGKLIKNTVPTVIVCDRLQQLKFLFSILIYFKKHFFLLLQLKTIVLLNIYVEMI